MAFQLIPFPISIIFVLVFGMAWIVVFGNYVKQEKSTILSLR